MEWSLAVALIAAKMSKPSEAHYEPFGAKRLLA